MDPIDTEDERIPALKQMVADLLRQMDEQLHLHDFRVVFGDTHTNLIFDLEVPFGYANAGKLPSEIQKRVHQQDPSLMTVVTVEHQMI
jgi:DNA primase